MPLIYFWRAHITSTSIEFTFMILHNYVVHYNYRQDVKRPIPGRIWTGFCGLLRNVISQLGNQISFLRRCSQNLKLSVLSPI